MPITTADLKQLGSLDDLIALAAALGYTPQGEELGAAARERLGLGSPSLGVRRAAIVGRHGAFRVYGMHIPDATRSRVAAATEHLIRATPGEQRLVLALDDGPATLAVAAPGPAHTGTRIRQFRVGLVSPSAVSADILHGLTPRSGEGALTLAMRVADTLADEGLTRRFFREFGRLRELAAERAADMPRATTAERRDFALVVLTRVLFLYFVQAKGWLAGRGDFLPSALDTALARGHHFHRTVFEPLCFGALSVPARARSRAARTLGAMPFLNGGLFERHALERRWPRAHLPNEIWRDVFDDLFERFHFTVREHDDRDAVKPEMLGRVFEGLMAPDRRRASGTYFTPPELLQHTVSLALDAALEGRAHGSLRDLRVLDPAVGSGAFLLETLHQIETRLGALLPGEDIVARRRALVRECLFGVDQDPMAVRLAELRLWLALVCDDTATLEGVAPLPNLDQNLRQGDSLLSPLDLARTAGGTVQAPRLARVGEQRAAYFAATGRDKATLARRIRADERIVAAEVTDAAIAVLTARLTDSAATAGSRDLFGARPRRTVAQADQVKDWRRQRRELTLVRRRIATDAALPFFSFDIHFGTITARGGFDVVLGNPPWVRGERLPASMRIALARQYASFRAATARPGGFAHLPDLAVAFVERALALVRADGVVAMVLPSKLLRTGYAGPLRHHVRQHASALHLEDRAHAPSSGFAATVFPCVWVLRRRQDPAARATVRIVTADATITGRAAPADFATDPFNTHAPWLAIPGRDMRALRAALEAAPPLCALFRPQLGVKTGANHVFLRPVERANELPQEHRVPAVLGRDIAPFRFTPSSMMLCAVDRDATVLPAVSDEVHGWLRPHVHALARRTDARGAPPWTVFRTDLLGHRLLVVWRDIAVRLEAAVIDRNADPAPVPINTCYGVGVPDHHTAHWLAAWLNSSLARAIAALLAERASGGALRFSAGVVGALPIPSQADPVVLRSLAAIGAAAARGDAWNQHDLDAIARDALPLDTDARTRLERLGDALRGKPRGNR